ncbi:MAG: DUF2523 family protein [Methylophilaceae bacterium]
MQALWGAIKGIYNFIIGFPAWLLSLLVKLLTSVLLMIKDAVCWVFDQLFQIVITMLNAFDFTAINEATSYMNLVPADVVNILGLCGVGYCLGLIATALVIRFLLQLIPFVRLGS